MGSTNRVKPYYFLIAVTYMCLSACASVVRNPLPEELHQDVTVLGRSDYRQWGDATQARLVLGVIYSGIAS